jgi:4-diphosphocytidyl-2-C-methyl-D-erythritol kinase
VSARSEGRSVRVLAPAKINAWLEVLARRADGYHDVDTGVLAVDLCDVIEARAVAGLGGVRLSVGGPHATADVPSNRSNLAYAAASSALAFAASQGNVRSDLGIELRLTKHVPSQAGLGGGSSDAAAAMLAVERACEFEVDSTRAHEILAALGSDCVFFRAAASTGFARCTGRGECVAPRAAIDRSWNVALITPRVAAPTAAVYGALAGLLRKTGTPPIVRPDVFDLGEAAARNSLFNRLEDAALALLPELRAWRTLFDAHGASHFRLSGSGASFFGLFRDRAECAASLEQLRSAAASRGLATRGEWVLRPAGHGARVAPSE